MTNEAKEELWIAYLDFMRNEWPSLGEINEVEIRFKKFNCLAPPNITAYGDWADIKSRNNRYPNKRMKTR